jgi:hypothetical protein
MILKMTQTKPFSLDLGSFHADYAEVLCTGQPARGDTYSVYVVVLGSQYSVALTDRY